MAKIKFEDLLVSGAHFGHVTRKWNPNYKPYILMEKNGVHIINLDETIRNLNKALDFISSKAKIGKKTQSCKSGRQMSLATARRKCILHLH